MLETFFNQNPIGILACQCPNQVVDMSLNIGFARTFSLRCQKPLSSSL